MNQVRKHWLFIPIGVAVWLGFLIAMRLIGSSVFYTGNPVLVAFYIGAFPITFVALVLIATLTGVPIRGMFMPVVIMTCTALLCDGLAVNFTDFYGATDDQVRASAGFLLWGASAGLIISLWLSDEGKATS